MVDEALEGPLGLLSGEREEVRSEREVTPGRCLTNERAWSRSE